MLDTYRPDVDGLRAIAIIAVVLYHAHVPGFGGGFVGVDVFFVISGYLIIGLLSREFEQRGDLSLAGFYERRIRRLGPALVVVLAVTLLLGAVYLTPINGEQQGLAKSAIATVALVSNLYFARHTGGYFDGPAEAQPLLHTWSLSVEEQFYLFWPLVVLAAGRYALRRGHAPLRVIAGALLALFALSFAISLWWTSAQPQTAFFAAPTRAWEFAVGGLVYFALCRPPVLPRYGNLLAAAGLVAIGISVGLFHSDMAFPGYLAMLPVMGTAAVIIGCAWAPQSLVTRSLSLRPVVAVGLVSYGWYLWHWPLLSIARVHTLGEINAFGVASLCILSLGLAALTFRYVEAPIRYKRVALMAKRRRAFGAGAIAMLGIISCSMSLGVHAKYVWPRDPSHSVLRAALAAMETPKLPNCVQPRPYTGQLVDPANCALPKTAQPPVILVWGDSHAFHLAPLIASYAELRQTQARIRFKAGCPPLKDYEPDALIQNGATGCIQYNDDILEEIEELKKSGLHTVILAARWINYFANSKASHEAAMGARRTITALDALGIRTIVVGPLPQFAHNVPSCLLRKGAANCNTDRKEVEASLKSVIAALQLSVSGVQSARVVEPISILCDVRVCPPLRDGVVLFYDDNHLSFGGSRLLLPLLTPELDWAVSMHPSAPLQRGRPMETH